ncbi:MAG: hypothetical protein OXC69_01605 [Candidatus Tectomicrobia bacterium]|nr:hypothetical protein [Candidatus Tectomicrobia bacterium]
MNRSSKDLERQPDPGRNNPECRNLWHRLKAVSVRPLRLRLRPPYISLRPSARPAAGVSKPLAGLVYLLCLVLSLLLNACDGGDGTLPDPTEDPITPEIRTAVEAGDLAALSDSDLPEIPGIDEFVIDPDLAVVLGKAFFWEMNTGNNGQACASCHFHAGTDRRIQNSLHPGGKDEAFFEGDAAATEHPLFVFDPVRSGNTGGPNYTLSEHDFPFHDKADPADRDSPIVFDTDDVVGSQGVLDAEFHSLGLNGRTRIGEDPDDKVDCEPVEDDLFNVGGSMDLHARVRRVTPRNPPTVINAALNHRNFWDGRASHIFNGVDNLGRREGDARVWKAAEPHTTPTRVTVRLDNSSLASQATAPPLSGSEMSCAANDINRTFAHIGRKLLLRPALENQRVHPDDSVLGAFRDADGLGLAMTFAQLIQETFDPVWWDAPAWTTCGQDTQRTALPRGNNQDGQECFDIMEANFPLFWGLAIQAYECTLLSGHTRFDTFVREVLAAGTSDALSESELRGLHLFLTDGRCIECHLGAALTSASVEQIKTVGVIRRAATALSDTLGPALLDEGFFNIGVQHRGDFGLGRRAEPDVHPDGPPLSFSAQYAEGIADRDFARDGVNEAGGRNLLPDPCRFEEPLTESDLPGADIARCPNDATALNPEFGADDLSGLRVAVDGAFKTPTLRNVEFTGPYMHNGGMSTLEQVIEFYNRGGDFVSRELAENIEPLDLTEEQQADLIAFLRTLTDERVLHRQAPFDHPELFIAHGHGGDQEMLDCMDATRIPVLGTEDEERALGFRLNACEHIEQIDAVGRGGAGETIKPFAAILEEGL